MMTRVVSNQGHFLQCLLNALGGMDLQAAEAELAQASEARNSAIVALVRQLNEAVVYASSDNEATNRKLWDAYAASWSPSTAWVRSMADDVAMLEDLQTVGDEWAPMSHVHEIVQTFILPFISSESNVLEVGSGGGRIAKVVAEAVHSLHCFDISKAMIERAQAYLQDCDNVTFTHVQRSELPGVPDASIDFAYSFDVLVHVDLHTIHKYLREFHRVLRPGAKAFISTANLTAPGGWDRFVKQSHASVGGFCFTSPDAIKFIVEQTGLRIVQEGQTSDSNVYLHRDYLVVLEKPAAV